MHKETELMQIKLATFFCSLHRPRGYSTAEISISLITALNNQEHGLEATTLMCRLFFFPLPLKKDTFYFFILSIKTLIYIYIYN